MPEWQEDPRPVLEQVCGLWRKARQQGDAWNEAQTEREFIQPVLDLLGWRDHYIVQPKSVRSGRVSRPDYALFTDLKTRTEAYQYQGQDEPFYQRAAAIAEAKYWGRPLSLKETSQRDAWKADANPSFQMVSYLVGTGVAWGILTNGMQWRLYSREVSSTASEFYEVDLRELLDFLPMDSPPTEEHLEQFRRWWLFFRREAFLPDAQGRSFLQRVHEGSTSYARQVSDRLKKLIFEQVMPEIAGGFVAYRRRQLGVEEETEQSLREIYQASLSLLYKLLFLLYAEARGLLPMQNPGYQEQSLTALARWAAERLDHGQPLSDALHATGRYEALLALFRRIDQGDPSLGIPRYNGGLFHPAHPDNQFLEKHRLSDRVVARAVDILAREEGEPVDYAYISVRNLGAIYEGLLEYKLRLLDAAEGRVELVNDKGERKATGSYYTPDYIVNYIVERTLRPILDERAEVFRQAMDRCAELRRKLGRANRPKTVQLLRQELDQAEYEAREAFLGIKVLDPAMGSGHFLVNAVDFLADGVIRRMQAYHDQHPEVPWEWNPIHQMINRVRSEILEEMGRQGIQVDAGRLDDTALVTRLVMKRCIYGVDLNPLAVELAKVSLWLHSFTVGAPLGFLDHHLRCGNSLLGVDVRTVQRAMKLAEGNQLALFAGPFAGLLDLTSLMLQVAEKSDATLADVQQSAQIYQQFQTALLPYKQVLNLWMSQYFGNGGIQEFLRTGGQEVLAILRGQQPPSEQEQKMLARASQLANEKRFFHWDLEFPEVFIDLRRRDWAEQPGFQAVIGNPPWVSFSGREKKQISPEEHTYFSTTYKCFSGWPSLHTIFGERAFSLLASGGRHSFIVPDQVGYLRNYNAFRKLFLGDRTSEAGVFLAEVKYTGEEVFEEVVSPTLVYVVSKGYNTKVHITDRQGKEKELEYSLLIGDPDFRWTFESKSPIWEKLRQISVTLKKEFGDPGVHTGNCGKKLVLPQPRGVSAPLLEGGNIERYTIPEPGVYLKLDYKPQEKEYFTIRDRAAYKRTKLLVRQTAAYPIATLHTGDYFRNSLLAFFGHDLLSHWYILTLLNSTLLRQFYREKFVESGQTAFPQVKVSYLRQLPIRRIAFTTPCKERKRLAAEGQKLLNDWIAAQAEQIGPEGQCRYPLEAFLPDPVGRWITQRLAPIHSPDPELVRRYNADPRHEHWQISETGPVEQADVVHDLLAHLAEQMIQMNRQKQEEMRGFLAWLERQLGAKLEELTGKARLRNYLGDYQKAEPHLSLEGLLDILRQNRRRLKKEADPDARTFQERLEKEYTASLAKLLPLKRRLAATDRLIDLVVFQLYGLTPEEAALVENG